MIFDLLKQLCAGVWHIVVDRVRQLSGAGSATQSEKPIENRIMTPVVIGKVEPTAADLAVLSDEYTSLVRLSTSRLDLDAEESARNPIYEIWKQQKPRAHKWSHYFAVYAAIFDARRHKELRILEIGVYQGASARLWKQYFEHPGTEIVGVDINPNCAQFNSPDERIHVRIGSQADRAFLDSVVREHGPFDIIIDDGSHHCSHMVASFNYLFAHALKDDGIYVAEDLHAHYWTPFRDTAQSFLDMCKLLMELIHAPYCRSVLEPWLQESHSDGAAAVSLNIPVIATMISEIRVFDSIVAIYKTRRKYLPRVLNPNASL